MLAPNTLLQDRYLVMRLLGQGGMGAVYQATDRKFGNAVALKETFYSDLQLRKAFSHEARLLNRLRHAALPVVMDYFSIGERQFLVMQYIPGKDLEQLLGERKERGQGVFLTAEILRWADQLLDALEYLHSQKPPIIHRDIKPQNLKLTPRGEVILLDFGLAKGIASQQSQVSQSIRGYTPNYASLEQIRGTGTDARSDIYSIGATLYHLLTGEMPQDAMTRIAAMLMGQPDPLPSISELNPEVSPTIALAIEKAMSPHPDQRYASAAMMRQSLRNASRNVAPASIHRTPTLTDEPVRNSTALAAAAAVAYDRQYKQESPVPSPAPAGNAVPQNGTDHIIILLDESKQDAAKAAAPGMIQVKQPAGTKPLQAVKRPEVKRSRPAASRPRRHSRIAFYSTVMAGLFAVTAGFFVVQARYNVLGSKWKLFTNQVTIDQGGSASIGATLTNSRTAAVPERIDALSYYIEIDSASGAKRETGRDPITAGSQFKFHFRPRQSGYLYVLAPGKNGNLQTFLTDQPSSTTGVVTNRVEAGKDFQFPYGDQWFLIQKDADKTPFTVIFSPTQLKSINSFSALSGRALTEAERQSLNDLKKDLTAMAPKEVESQSGVTLQVPRDKPESQPLIFGIEIKKR
ncbi:MAG TPA: protein kinase [Blastocatellia bacterium]|nr:protein kinase [Blastocatellia bacterium]